MPQAYVKSDINSLSTFSFYNVSFPTSKDERREVRDCWIWVAICEWKPLENKLPSSENKSPSSSRLLALSL